MKNKMDSSAAGLNVVAVGVDVSATALATATRPMTAPCTLYSGIKYCACSAHVFANDASLCSLCVHKHSSKPTRSNTLTLVFTSA